LIWRFGAAVPFEPAFAGVPDALVPPVPPVPGSPVVQEFWEKVAAVPPERARQADGPPPPPPPPAPWPPA